MDGFPVGTPPTRCYHPPPLLPETAPMRIRHATLAMACLLLASEARASGDMELGSTEQ